MLYCQLESWLECQKAIEAAREIGVRMFYGPLSGPGESAVIGRARCLYAVRCSMQSHKAAEEAVR